MNPGEVRKGRQCCGSRLRRSGCAQPWLCVGSCSHRRFCPGRCHVVRQPLDVRDQPYKFIIYLEGRIRVRGQFPSWCELAPRELSPAPAAAQSEGFSFTVPKVTLLVNADYSSLV